GGGEREDLHGPGRGEKKRETESQGDQNVAHSSRRLRIARSEEAEYGVPRHDLEKAAAGQIGDEAPGRRRRQFAQPRKQLIEEEDRANPKEQVAAGQIESAARFGDPRRGLCRKHAQPVRLPDPSGTGRGPTMARVSILRTSKPLQILFAFTSKASPMQFTGQPRDLCPSTTAMIVEPWGRHSRVRIEPFQEVAAPF